MPISTQYHKQDKITIARKADTSVRQFRTDSAAKPDNTAVHAARPCLITKRRHPERPT
jgi:hypothetical protein